MLGTTNNDDSIDSNDTEIIEEECCDPSNYASRCTSRLRSFAWSVILATYSEQCLASSGPERVKTWVDSVCRYNTEEGLKAILKQTHHASCEGTADERNQRSDLLLWTPAAMAQRIKSSQSVERCRIVVGSQDKMAHPKQALRLAQILAQTDDDITVLEEEGGMYKVMEGHGHAVPMEAMRLWIEDVLEFLQ